MTYKDLKRIKIYFNSTLISINIWQLPNNKGKIIQLFYPFVFLIIKLYLILSTSNVSFIKRTLYTQNLVQINVQRAIFQKTKKKKKKDRKAGTNVNV